MQKDTLNILHLIKYPGQGGSERYITSLTERMHNKGCRVFLAYSDEGPLLDRMKQLNVECFHISMKNPWDIKAAKELKNLCKRLDIDVVHSHFLRENFISVYSGMMGNNASIINTVHMLEEKKGFVRTVNRIISSKDDGIIAVSEAVKNLLISEGLAEHKIKLIYTGVDADWFAAPLADNDLRRKFAIGAEDFLVVSAARFSLEKGHKLMLNAIATVKQLLKGKNQSRKMRFILSGDGELFEECKNLAKELGIEEDVVFTGYMKDIRPLYQAGDLYVSHSLSESFGISILEAMASGLPIVASNSGGPAEIITEETACGILTAAGDSEELAKAIIKMMEDVELYEKCRNNAITAVKEKFNIDKTVEETYEYYLKSRTSIS